MKRVVDLHEFGGARESLYTFGGSEESVRRVGRRFLRYFRSCKHVLDLGCGRGIFLDLLAKEGIAATGVDRAEESLNACRSRGFHSVFHDDIFCFLSNKEEAFDGIFCSHVIEHLTYEDAIHLLELSYRALQPGGILVVVTPNSSDLQILGEIFWLDPTHVRFYPQILLEQMAKFIGYREAKGGSLLGSWKSIPKRDIPGYILRRLLLGKYFGKPNTFLVARKPDGKNVSN